MISQKEWSNTLIYIHGNLKQQKVRSLTSESGTAADTEHSHGVTAKEEC